MKGSSVPLPISDPLDEIAVSLMSRSGVTDWLIENGWTGQNLQLLGCGFILGSSYTMHTSHRIRSLSFAMWMVLNAVSFAVAYKKGDLVRTLQMRLLIQTAVGVTMYRLIRAVNEGWLWWICGWPAVGLGSLNTILLWGYQISEKQGFRDFAYRWLRICRWFGPSTWNVFYLILLSSSAVQPSRSLMNSVYMSINK